jgi:hypothetical protein
VNRDTNISWIFQNTIKKDLFVCAVMILTNTIAYTKFCSGSKYTLLYHTTIPTNKSKKINSMVWVRKRTIPAEGPPLVSEVIANFCGQRVPRGQRDGFLRPYSRISRQEPPLVYQVAPQLYSRGWLDPVPDPLLFFSSGSAGNRTRASGSVAKNSDH